MSLSCDALEFWTAKFDRPGENSDDRFCFSLPIVEIRRPEFRPDRHLPPTHLGSRSGCVDCSVIGTSKFSKTAAELPAQQPQTT